MDLGLQGLEEVKTSNYITVYLVSLMNIYKYQINHIINFFIYLASSHLICLVKRILRYLQGTVNHGLLLAPASLTTPITITSFCYADWACDSDDRRSTSRGLVYIFALI